MSIQVSRFLEAFEELTWSFSESQKLKLLSLSFGHSRYGVEELNRDFNGEDVRKMKSSYFLEVLENKNTETEVFFKSSAQLKINCDKAVRQHLCL